MNIIKHYIDYVNLINEGFIKTYDGKLAINDMIRSLNLLKFDAGGIFNQDQIQLILKNFNHIQKNRIDNLFDHISTTLTNRFGWFPSNMHLINTNGLPISKRYDESELKLKQDIISEVKIDFNSKFDEIETNSPSKLYHLSIQEYENRILKNGLFPKSKSKISSHTERVYLCKSTQDCGSLIPQMKLHYSEEKDINLYTLGNKKWRKNTKWIIYEIDNSGKNKIVLYKDPGYINGYYTLDNINPEFIEVNSREK